MQPAFNCSGAHLRGQTTTGPVDEPSSGVQPYQFVLEADHFADCVRNNKQPRTPGEEGLKDMLLMEEQVIRSHSLDQPLQIFAVKVGSPQWKSMRRQACFWQRQASLATPSEPIFTISYFLPKICRNANSPHPSMSLIYQEHPLSQ
jgi:hypothetical protein